MGYSDLRVNLLQALLLSGAHKIKSPQREVTKAWRSLTDQMFDEGNRRQGAAPLAMYRKWKKDPHTVLQKLLFSIANHYATDYKESVEENGGCTNHCEVLG